METTLNENGWFLEGIKLHFKRLLVGIQFQLRKSCWGSCLFRELKKMRSNNWLQIGEEYHFKGLVALIKRRTKHNEIFSKMARVARKSYNIHSKFFHTKLISLEPSRKLEALRKTLKISQFLCDSIENTKIKWFERGTFNKTNFSILPIFSSL